MVPCGLEIRVTKSQNASAYELDIILTSVVLFKGRHKFNPALLNSSFFSTSGHQTNTTEMYFSVVHILHRTPQKACRSLWLPSSYPATTFSTPRLCWSSQASTWNSPHLKSASAKLNSSATSRNLSGFLAPPPSSK